MARKYSKKASAKVGRAMKKRKAGTLKSGRSGKKVKSRKQAIAIGLSEARAEGKKVPKKAAKKARRRRSGKRKSNGAVIPNSSLDRLPLLDKSIPYLSRDERLTRSRAAAWYARAAWREAFWFSRRHVVTLICAKSMECGASKGGTTKCRCLEF